MLEIRPRLLRCRVQRLRDSENQLGSLQSLEDNLTLLLVLLLYMILEVVEMD